MPVHNEAACIETTLREWHAELSPKIDLRFVIAEDGSRDTTKEVLRKLSLELPLQLDMTDERRGYGGAMRAALRATSTPYVLTSDSDGQSDPRDFWRLWERRDNFELTVGWRVNRADRLSRKVMSKSFKLLHRTLFGTNLNDPSCNVMLFQRPALEKLLPKLGLLSEGFQWELVARAIQAGIRLGEVPIHHRHRTDGGSTVVFKPSRVPGIAWRNGVGLLKVWWDPEAS